jgi:hypothetical protein
VAASPPTTSVSSADLHHDWSTKRDFSADDEEGDPRHQGAPRERILDVARCDEVVDKDRQGEKANGEEGGVTLSAA